MNITLKVTLAIFLAALCDDCSSFWPVELSSDSEYGRLTRFSGINGLSY
jgi:hypothetical protein